MISTLIMFLLITSIGMFMFLKFKIKFEIIIPIIIFAIIVILYIFGILGLLKTGVYIICIISLFCFISIIYYFIKNRKLVFIKERIGEILSPGLIFYLLIFILVWWAHRGRRVFYGDEITHWALVVKNMSFFNALGNIPESSIVYRSYPPAISLFQYLWIDISKLIYGVFLDENLYRSINILYFSLMLPLFKDISWKNYRKSFFVIIFIIFVPLMFFDRFFFKLQVDGIIGVITAYILLSYFNSKMNIIFFINIFLSLFVLSLVKESSIIFSVIVIIIIFIDLLLRRKKNDKEFAKNKAFLLTLVLLFIILAPVSWNIYRHSVDDHFINGTVSSVSNLSENDLLEKNKVSDRIIMLLKGDMPNYTDTVVYEAFSSIHTRLYGTEGNIIRVSILSSAFLLLVLSIIILTYMKRNIRFRSIKTLFVLINIGGLLYFVLCIMGYLVAFSQTEAENAASITRYMGSYLLFILIFVFSVFINAYCIEKKTNGKTKRNVAIILIFIILASGISTILEMTLFAKRSINKSINDINRLGYAINIDDKINYKSDNIYLICSDNKVIGKSLHTIIFYLSRYQLVPNKLSQSNSNELAPITYKTRHPLNIGLEPRDTYEFATVPYTIQQWEAILYKGFTHVYIYAADEQFIKEYGALFENTGDIQEDTLFIIEKDENTIILRKFN